jgi:transposase
MSTNNALKLGHWTVLHDPHFVNDDLEVITAEYQVMPDHCPKCGGVRLYRHGTKVVKYRDSPSHGHQAVIEARIVRFKCRECGETFMQPLPDMDENRRMTKRLFNYIVKQGIRQNYSEVARHIGMNEKTVRNICEEHVNMVRQRMLDEGPLILGIDEMKLGGHKRTVFIDVAGKRLLDLIEVMNRRAVDRWLYLMPNKERVRLVTIDMWGPYRAACRAIIPQARIIVDKWHIVSKANDALDRVRSRHRRIIKDKRNPHRGRLLLHTKPERLSPMRRMVLDAVVANTPLIGDAWRAKEGFYDIWKAADRAAAEARYDAWKAGLPASIKPEFGKLVITVDNWREEIFTYFEYRFTNAYTEARNRLVKDIQREGRGYRFDRLRAKAILQEPLTSVPLVLCESCLGLQPKTEFIKPKHILPMFPLPPDRPLNLMIMCRECNSRFHTEMEIDHVSRSTSESE